MARILIIDDEKVILDLFERILALAGHEVVVVTDSRIGLKQYKDKAFDLVITDMVMPEYSGMNTILDLIRDDIDAKIIAISGGGAIEAERYLEIAKEIGAKKVLLKPVSGEQLLNAVDEVLG